MIVKKIHVHPSLDALHPDLRNALVSRVPVSFVSCPGTETCSNGDVLLSLSGNDEVLNGLAGRAIRCFHVAGVGSERRFGKEGQRVQFSQSKHLDKRLRGHSILHEALPNHSPIRSQPGDEILASCGESPVWISREKGGYSANIVSIPVPTLTGDNVLPSDHLYGERFLGLLPLLHFLREVTSGQGWKPPILRACLMFDDPNLHWTSYGFLPFRKLVNLSKDCNFHVAFAMVPLDAWGSHPWAVDLFRKNPDRFSLLIHGNNHIKAELAQNWTEAGFLALLAQGLYRISRFEEATGLPVARVMVPPHEGYTDVALSAMLSLGFDGACISIGSLRRGNRHRQWPPAFGLQITEMMGNGFPVFHRFNVNSSCIGEIIISAFLDRPIIPVGHHDTLAGGLKVLEEIAELINSFGDVSWEGPGKILRSNYLSRVEENILWIKPYSCRIQLTVPEGVSAIGVQPSESPGEPINWEFTASAAANDEPRRMQTAQGGSLPVKPGDRIELVAQIQHSVNFREVVYPKLPYSAIARRVLCEARDRFAPLLAKVRKEGPTSDKLLNKA